MVPHVIESLSSLVSGGSNGVTKATESVKVDVLHVEHKDHFSHDRWIPKSDDDHAVLAIRNLALDITMQNGGGHGGSAVGMAAIGVALWKYTMRYNPNNPDWFDRDRFILSNGHASIFLYAMNYLVGYDAWTMDELKGYGNAKLNGFKTMAHAHPEIDCPGVEVTTGPLGQGIANAVGMAMASKILAARFNEPGYDVVQSRIYCLTGDGCLMEGVALEAIALAGHFRLDNLVLLYDNNQVTCDGPLPWINSENINAKMLACGWEVLDVPDGRYDVAAIQEALNIARQTQQKQPQPVFINIRTVIGIDTAVAGTAKAHHGAFDKESIARSKALAGLPPDATHVVPDRALQFFRERKSYGAQIEQQWNGLISRYSTAHPAKAAAFASCRQGDLLGSPLNILEKMDAAQFEGMPTRKINGIILEQLWKETTSLCGGGADLVNSNQLRYGEMDVFGPRNYSGRYIRYGIREHAMASISNGLAAYNPGTFLPITATFFMFYIYAAPGIRMGALSSLQCVHIATHDSFAEGQNGPTHQPVELDSLFRAMPKLYYIRPCDGEELLGAWSLAISSRHNPSLLSVARDPVTTVVPNTSRFKVRSGAYVIHEDPEASLTLASCGSNLHHAVAAAALLSEHDEIRVRLVSAPSLDLFHLQSQEYKDQVFPRDGRPIVSVEEYVPTVWARYATASCGMKGFGYSASNESNYARFGLDSEGIRTRVLTYLKHLNGQNAKVFGWRDL